MNKEPLITVVIPCYNVEKYLDDCINSVLNQTYTNKEIILVDDGSADSTPQKCDDYSNKYSNIKIVHQKNAGLSSARNTGIENASGEYITFIDSDDLIASNMLETMVEIVNKECADIVSLNLKRVYENELCEPNNPKGDYQKFNSTQALELIYAPRMRVISCCGKLFSIKLFDDFRFPIGLYYEDEYSTPRLFDLAKSIVISQKDLYFYMQRDNDSIMRGRLTDKKINDSLYIGENRIEFYESKGYKKLVKKAKIDYYYKLENLYKDSLSNNIMKSAEQIDLKKKRFSKENLNIVISLKIKDSLYKIYKSIFK